MSLHQSTVDTLIGMRCADSGQDALRHTYLAFLAARQDGCLRRCEPGHITASALVFNAARTHVLFTLHPRVGAWIQLGGHCEPQDATIADAALREATEESGLSGLTINPNPVALHTHPITCSLGVPTRHLDIRFVVSAPDTPTGALPDPIRSDESVDLQWWPIDDLSADTHTDEMATLVAYAQHG